MIYNENKIYATVWKVTPAENGKYIDLQITTSEKDQEGNYKNSGWFPRCIGHSVNSLKGLKEGDRIVITKSKFTNERYKNENNETRSAFRFLVLEASFANGDSQPNEPPTVKKEATKAVKETTEEDKDDCPW